MVREVFENELDELLELYLTKTSHTQNGICTLKIQYFS